MLPQVPNPSGHDGVGTLGAFEAQRLVVTAVEMVVTQSPLARSKLLATSTYEGRLMVDSHLFHDFFRHDHTDTSTKKQKKMTKNLNVRWLLCPSGDPSSLFPGKFRLYIGINI